MNQPDTAFEAYLLAQAEKKIAYERYNFAASALNNAQIRERLAEIKSQHEPLAALMSTMMTERERLYAAAFYVVVGRMPE